MTRYQGSSNRISGEKDIALTSKCYYNDEGEGYMPSNSRETTFEISCKGLSKRQDKIALRT